MKTHAPYPGAGSGEGGATGIDAATRARIVSAQRVELTEHHIYTRLAAADRRNAEVLSRIARDEKAHHDFLAALSGRCVAARRRVVWWYVGLARLFGVTFALKLMERGERSAQLGYRELSHIEGVEEIIHDEEEHEQELLGMLRDERLEYAGSMVLGLNDALVELTGALAGFTLALAEPRTVAAAGLVTGIAAALSMASSEYFSSKSEHQPGASKSPVKAAGYTGTAYLVAVALLITPYFVMPDITLALVVTLGVAVAIIATLTLYLSVARDIAFWPRFTEMSVISLGVAAVSFGIGFLVNRFL